jgi:hypothetical protein
MKPILIATAICVLAAKGYCQEGLLKPPRAVSVEVSTLSALLTMYNVNYDARFRKRPDGFGYHVGIGLANTTASMMLMVPMEVNYITGRGPNYFEAGLGFTFAKVPKSFINDDNTREVLFPFTPLIGYRYQSNNTKGVLFRVFASPWIMMGQRFTNIGVSLGYKF